MIVKKFFIIKRIHFSTIMKKEEVQKEEKKEKVKKTKGVDEEAQEYYEAESWQFSSCGD